MAEDKEMPSAVEKDSHTRAEEYETESTHHVDELANKHKATDILAESFGAATEIHTRAATPLGQRLVLGVDVGSRIAGSRVALALDGSVGEGGGCDWITQVGMVK